MRWFIAKVCGQFRGLHRILAFARTAAAETEIPPLSLKNQYKKQCKTERAAIDWKLSGKSEALLSLSNANFISFVSPC
jgi:hypothetical protein